ncbi:MAG: hypothetical protein AABX24_00900 [Nanoarchaeota archaeon]
MKKMLYAGIFSGLMSSCTVPQTSYANYPVVVDEIKSIYIKDSNGNCYLKMPQTEGRELLIYDEKCDKIADSVALSSHERFFYLYERKELNLRSGQFMDMLLQKAEEYLKLPNPKGWGF